MNTKKNKIIVLLLCILLIFGIGTGIYLVTHKDTAIKEEPEQIVTSQDNSINPAESELQESEETMHVIEDGLLFIPGGTFAMGSPDGERQRQEDETLHSVTVSAFYIDPYEVTQKDYLEIMGENPSHFEGDALPVENVTWYDAIQYCNKLSENKGLTPVYTIDGDSVTWDRSANGYRLPTEAEWEYAVRAGTTTIYNFGDQVHSDYANFEGSYPYLIEENYVSHRNPDVVTSRNRGETIAVTELAPNGFGLYQTHGNVAEWCFDYYGEYDLQNTTDPAGAVNGSLRVNRGGSYNDFGKHLRSAYRSATNPLDGDQNLGFRICRNAESIDETVTTTYSLSIRIPDKPKILIGCIMLCQTDVPEIGQLRLFAVEKEYRRYGVGTALINAFMEKAKSVGYQKLVLWTASPLTAAIHHYEKIGFQITESVENHTWSTNGETLDEIKMEIDMGTD